MPKTTGITLTENVTLKGTSIIDHKYVELNTISIPKKCGNVRVKRTKNYFAITVYLRMRTVNDEAFLVAPAIEARNL